MKIILIVEYHFSAFKVIVRFFHKGDQVQGKLWFFLKWRSNELRKFGPNKGVYKILSYQTM